MKADRTTMKPDQGEAWVGWTGCTLKGGAGKELREREAEEA
jgi:hypothetical protein